MKTPKASRWSPSFTVDTPVPYRLADLVGMIDGWAGQSMRGAMRWLHLPFSAACWFLVAGTLGRLYNAR